jgi:predicted N-acetyltransferase YhbS
MSEGLPAAGVGLTFQAGSADETEVRRAVLEITRLAFLINPVTGERIKGERPVELAMVEAFCDRKAVDHLHLALLDGRAVGYIIYARGSLTENPEVRVQGLTIMGVHPEFQRKTIGTRLLTWSVRQMRESCDALFVLGHPGFYPRAGFVPAHTLGLTFSIPAPKEACMVAPLSARRLSPGVISYHPIVNEFC